MKYPAIASLNEAANKNLGKASKGKGFTVQLRQWVLNWTCIGMAVLLQGCAIGEDYEAPTFLLDAKWFALEDEVDSPLHHLGSEGIHTQVTKTAGPATLPKEKIPKDPNAVIEPVTPPVKWWETFHDHTLSKLIEEALVRNNQVKIAEERVVEASATAEVSFSGLFPQIDGRASGTRGTLGGSFGEHLDTSSQRGFNGTLDLDVFGATRRRVEAADAAVKEAEASLAQTKLQLISQVARSYVDFRDAQQEEQLTLSNLALQNRSLQVTKAQRKEQVVSDLNIYRAVSQVKNTEARLPQIRTDRYTALNHLASLLDVSVKDMQAKLEDNEPIPSAHALEPAAAPIAIIRNRPDVKTAEDQLMQATALKAAALADFFPQFSLQGFFGSTTSEIFGNLKSWNGTLGGVMPLLNFGRLQGQLHVADARKNQAFFNYRQIVLGAVEEVENGFYSYKKSVDRSDLLAESARNESNAANVAREQYIAGIGQQLDLLDAERGALDAEVAHVQAESQVATNIIQLYTALGVYHDSSDTPVNTEDGKSENPKALVFKKGPPHTVPDRGY